MSSPPETPAGAGVGNPHRIVISIALVAGFAELAYFLVNFSAMPVYLKYKMGYGEASVTLIGAAFLICEGLMKGPFGILGDRIGRKRLILAGPLVSVATSLLTLAVQPHEWYFFVFLRVLDGLGAAALWPAALAMIADVVPAERRSQAMSMFNVTYLIGVALAPMIGGGANDLARLLVPGLLDTAYYNTSFFVACGLFIATSAVAAWGVPSLPPHHLRGGEVVEGSLSVRALVESLRRIPQPLLMAFITFFGIGQIMLLVKLFAMEAYGLSETQFGAIQLVPALVIAAASIPLGTIGDRIGKARAVRWGLGLCAFSMWALILLPNFVALIIGGSLIGVGFVIAFPSWMAYISESCEPSQRGAVMGAVGTAQGAGAMAGAPLGGYLYEHSRLNVPFLPWIGPHYAPFIGCAALLLAAWLLALKTIRDTQTARPRELAS